MTDLISRQAAIDALGKEPKFKIKMIKTYAEGMSDQWFKDVASIASLPSAQPEIIRCKDCKHRYEDACPMYHIEWVESDDDGYIELDDVVYDYTEDAGWCFKAERRDDG